jgi:Zn-dependent protease
VSAAAVVLGLTWFVVFLFSTTLHEAAHAFAALRLGDRTAYEGGQVSLNPIPHIRREPVGMVLVPLLTYATNGWIMGWASAPYDPVWAHRFPRRAALMAMAGPLANLLLVVLAGAAIRWGAAAGVFYPPETIHAEQVAAAQGPGMLAAMASPLSIVFSLNLLLFTFNLLPLPPLDGSSIVPMFLSETNSRRYRELFFQPGFSLLGLLLAWKAFPYLYRPIHLFALSLLYPGVTYR